MQTNLPGLISAALFAYLTGNVFGVALASVVTRFDPGSVPVAHAFGLIFTWVIADFAWKLSRRAFVGASGAFWTSRLGRFLIGRIVGVAILALLYKPASIAASLCMWLAAWMWLSAGGGLSAAFAQGLVWLFYGLTFAFAWVSRRRVKIFIGKASRPLRLLMRTLNMAIGGSARFAGICEEWRHAWKPGRILLGASMYDRHWLVGIEDDRHFATIATNWSGKGRDAIIGNLLTWP